MAAPRSFIHTKHSRDRQAERNVTDQEIEEVLANWHTKRQDRDGNDVLIGDPGGRYVKVVVAQGSNPPRIITVGD